MNVTIQELRGITNRLLDHVEALGVKAVEIPHDYYWVLSRDQVYDPTLETPTPSLGQLTDDWHELQLIHQGQRPPVAIALSWLASILRSVGEEVIG